MKTCPICAAPIANIYATCGVICREKLHIQRGAKSVPCASCGDPAEVQFGVTVGVLCAGCELAMRPDTSWDEEED